MTLFELLHVGVNSSALALKKPLNGVRKGGMRQPVRAGGSDWQQGTRHLVLALGTSFKTLVAIGNTPFQRLVIAGFKMQAIDAGKRTPISAVGNRWFAHTVCI